MAPSAFDAEFEQARTSIFRLETLQVYGGSGEDPALDAFLAGKPLAYSAGKDEWLGIIRDRVSSGCRMQRVHVVTEPLTDYMRFELTWGYAPNVEVGEEIGIIPVSTGQPWPAGLPESTDFWLFDSTVLYDMSYDRSGGWLGVELITDPERINRACRWRDMALDLSESWRSYVYQRSSLARHLGEIPAAS